MSLELNLRAEKKLANYLGISEELISGFFLGAVFSKIPELDQFDIDDQFATAMSEKGFYYKDIHNDAELSHFLENEGVLTYEEFLALRLIGG